MRPRKINFKEMTQVERNAYERSKYAERKARRASIDEDGILRKTCSKCTKRFPCDEQHFAPVKRSIDGFSWVCINCRVTHGSTKKTSAAAFKQRKGYTREQRDAKLRSAKYCDICGSDRYLVVDHCHDKKQIRGVLCNLCNSGIGKLGDNLDILQAAVNYLLKSGAYRTGPRPEVRTRRWRAAAKVLRGLTAGAQPFIL